MEEVLNKILAKLDKIELDVSAIKSDVKQLDKKVDGITVVVAKTMEDITELKSTVEKQDVEIRVIKGGAAHA
jgi:peptidoglycan hydrolase CwlO-like protein